MLEKLSNFNEIPVIIVLITLVLTFALPYDVVSRYALYTAFYISVIYIFIRRRNIKSKEFILPLIIVIFSVIEILWGNIFKSIEYKYINVEYMKSAKRMIVCAVILYHVISFKDKINPRVLNLCGWILFFSFVYLSVDGALEYMETKRRIGFGMSATMGGYIYAAQALLVLYIASICDFKYKNILVFVLTILIFCVVSMTGTRAIIIIYPLCVLFLYIKLKFLNIKYLLAFIVFIFISVSTNLISLDSLNHRYNSIISEVTRYQDGNVSSSLGARFSLWKAGIDIISKNPYGLSADERNALAKEYIHSYEYSNRAALDAIEFHLHNDFINTGSLLGIIGIIAIIILYLSLGYYSFTLTRDYTVFIFIIFPLVLFGLSDTLLISSKFMYVTLLNLVMYICFTYKNSKYNL